LETVNFSTAKQKYSFSKGARFQQLPKVLNEAIGYDLPATLAKRSAGFGVGPRFKTPMASRDESPPPDSYRLPSDFDVGAPGSTLPAASKGNVYSFGIGRQHFEKVYISRRHKIVDLSLPGPGTYVPKNGCIGTEGREFNFQGRSTNFNGKLSSQLFL